MKRLRQTRWSGQLLGARSGVSVLRKPFLSSVRCQSSAALADDLVDDVAGFNERKPFPSPLPERAAQSAKLAALHARLSLPQNIPLQTLARSLVTPSADDNGNFNNTGLAVLGASIINYHVLEYLVCKYPRLPMTILYEALRAYAGDDTLRQVASRWGVENAAAPGEEVDPGLLQWQMEGHHRNLRWGFVRSEDDKANVWRKAYRRGISSRVVYDNDFGDKVEESASTEEERWAAARNEAFASFVQSVVGSIYTHCGREAAKSFVTSHILSRQLDPSKMFRFLNPTRELSMLCAREGFEAPIARLESETGRLSRTPVFVVGIYSGNNKLGEAAASSLESARRTASMAALKAWYLYSPGNKVRVPSDMSEEGAKPWKAPLIDPGEII